MDDVSSIKRQILQNIIMIDPSKKCLDFLKERIQLDSYRGMQVSQHNRYSICDIKIILCALNSHLDKEGFLQIRTTDLSKRAYNIKGEEEYAEFVNDINKKRHNNAGTQDSIRKNYFVDFHRMGLIYRYDKNKKALNAREKSCVKYVGITGLGKRLINENNIVNENIIFTNAINVLMEGKLDCLLELMYTNDFSYVTENEFMYFLSFLNLEIGQKYYSTECLKDYILEYRNMSKFQKLKLDEYLKEYCTPCTFIGKGKDKTDKRDYHNWRNETQQIFSLLNQTAFFEVIQDRLCVRAKVNSALIQGKTGYKRSEKAKIEYFEKHAINKEKGYSLHHIVPLCSTKNLHECVVIDVWENLLYIDGKTHDIISQSNNKNIILESVNEDFILKHMTQKNLDIYCKKDINVLYNIANQSTMICYNKDLLNTLQTT